MKNCQSCNEAQFLMADAISESARVVPFALKSHFETCAICKAEWDELQSATDILENLSLETSLPSPELWAMIESRLSEKSQKISANPDPDIAPLWIRLLEYFSLGVVGFCLWFSLSLGQPYLLQFISQFGLEIPTIFQTQYGIFFLFFALGGFFALMAAPLLIPCERFFNLDWKVTGENSAK